MTRIWERLYIGSIADAEELAGINAHGITTVVSLSESAVTKQRSGVNYLHIPIQDDEAVPVGRFDAIIDAISENTRWGTVLLHSGRGVSRAPSMAAAYMGAVGYRSIDPAIDEIRRLRPLISPSDILLHSLKENLR